MKKENFKFINEGNGIEGIVAQGKIDTVQSSKIKIAIQDKKSDIIWDPMFECFIPKTKECMLEKGTVLTRKTLH